MNTNAFGPQLSCEVSDSALKRCFGNSHDVVVFYDHLAAIICHRKEGTAFAHQRFRQMRHANESPTGYFQGGQKSLALYIDYTSLERGLGRKGDGMHHKIERIPIASDAFKDRFHLSRRIHVERHHDPGVQLTSKRLNIFLCFVVEIGDREFGTECPKGLGATPGNRIIVGNANDKAFLAFEELSFDGGNHFRDRRPLRGAGALRRIASGTEALLILTKGSHEYSVDWRVLVNRRNLFMRCRHPFPLRTTAPLAVKSFDLSQ